MEIVCGLTIILLIGAVSCLLQRNHRQKQDIYDFTEKLERSLDELLNEHELEPAVYRQDDLWEKVYEKLQRISGLYTCKSREIREEKESLRELISDISHQTKTPLANIKLYQELLADEADLKESGEYLEKMGRQVEKLDFLLQNMVKLSRLETGTIKIRKSESFVSETLVEAIGAVIPKADKKNIQIHVDYDEKLRLNHDKKWTSEAVFNILDNAVKYTGEKGRINISVKREEIFTRITVSDTGKGIPLERQAAVFSRFYREPEVHDDEGIGIGLYLARKIISMQDGYIKLESEAGKGSAFHIYLPN